MKRFVVFLLPTMLVLWASDAPASSYRDAVLADNPVGYWRLGETSGTVASNQTVTSNHGVYQNSPTLGQTGAIINDPDKAVRVAVGTDMVEVGHTASLNLNPSGMTLEAWVTLTTAQSFGTLMMKSTTSSWSDGYGFYLEGGNLKLFVNQYNSSPASVAFPTSAAYRHVVGTYDGSFLRIYTNGVLAATQANTLLIDTTANSLRIGKGSGAGVNDYDWVGNIDEVAVYNYALAPGDIAEHYAIGFLGIPEPSSVALLGLGGFLAWRRRSR
jgi:hypothetical protein